MTLPLESIVEQLQASRKYRTLAPDVLGRTAAWAATRSTSLKDAVKRAKRKLHQIFSAYHDVPFAKIAAQVEATDFTDQAAAAKLCRDALGAHVSTAERVGHLEALFDRLHAVAPHPARVIDLGGGLNPFALPWMQLPPLCEYWHYDLDQELTELVTALLSRLNRPGGAECVDLLNADFPSTDVALLFKIAPVLEQQEPGAALRLLQSLQANFMVVSFPAQSIGGRRKGMTSTYEAFAQTLASQLNAALEVWPYPTETYYLLQRSNPAIKTP